MLDLKHIKETLRKDNNLKKSLKSLVNFCIKNKVLIIEGKADSIDLGFLCNYGILKQVENKYLLEDYTFFTYQYYENNKQALNLKKSKKFKIVTSKLNNLEQAFTSSGVTQGITKLSRYFWAIIILEYNEIHDFDFVSYLKSLNYDDNREEIYNFNAAYSISLPNLEIKVEAFYENAQILLEWVNTPKAHINTSVSTLLKGIRDKVYYDDKFGLESFKFVITKDAFNTTILIPIISGLFVKLGDDFYYEKIKPILQKEIYSVGIICGLSNINTIGEKEAKLLLNVYKKVNLKNTDILINSPKLPVSILKSKLIEQDSKIAVECFANINQLFELENQNLVYFILNEIIYIDRFDKEKTDSIVKLIEQPHFDLELYIDLIDQFFYSIEDIKYFMQIVLSIASNCPFKSIHTKLSSSINKFKDSDRLNFESFLIELLINNIANRRFMGMDIFNEISHITFTFKFDILSLEPINQYKLWVSICQYYREPKYVLPCLLPLIKSGNSLIQESFLCKLEEYSENYGMAVIRVLEDNLDMSDPQTLSALTRIKKYREMNFNIIKQKFDINELNPYYTQNKLFSEFNRNHSRTFSRKLQKSTEENSTILSLFPTVKLLKGGGWKMERNSEISKLSKISTSFSLPRIFFLEPEFFEYEQDIAISEDWDNVRFTEIEKHLSYEQ